MQIKLNNTNALPNLSLHPISVYLQKHNKLNIKTEQNKILLNESLL